MVLTKKQQAALVGMILGDGYLQKTGTRNARLRLEHSWKQKDYLEWKIKLLPQLFQGKPKKVERVHPISKRKYVYYRIQSNASPYLGKLRKVFYPENKKVIPENLERYLRHVLGLVVWYCDDGYYYPRDRHSILYLGKVSVKEGKITQRIFRKFIGIQGRIKDKKEKGLALYFTPQETLQFKIKTANFIPPMMFYKFPPDPVETHSR